MEVNKKNEIYFLELIHSNQVYITASSREVYVEDQKKKIFRSFNKGNKEDYYLGIYHRGYRILLHRLVWMYHSREPIPHKLQVNHIDGDKTNNCIDNLELVTGSENVKHAYTTGLSTISQKARELSSLRLREHNPIQVIDVKDVEYYRCQYHQRKLSVKDIQELTGASRRTIENMLAFRSFQYDPITGEYDKDLKFYYIGWFPSDKPIDIKHNPRKLSSVQIKEINDLFYNHNYSKKKLGKIYNVSRGTIRYAINYYNQIH